MYGIPAITNVCRWSNDNKWTHRSVPEERRMSLLVKKNVPFTIWLDYTLTVFPLSTGLFVHTKTRKLFIQKPSGPSICSRLPSLPIIWYDQLIKVPFSPRFAIVYGPHFSFTKPKNTASAVRGGCSIEVRHTGVRPVQGRRRSISRNFPHRPLRRFPAAGAVYCLRARSGI